MSLENYGIAEIIVDDSADMNKPSDVVADFYSGANYMNCASETATKGSKKFLTRWAEAKERIMQMMELIAYIPTAPIFYTRFLNRSTVLELARKKRETPQAFLARIRQMLDDEFAKRADVGGCEHAKADRKETCRDQNKDHAGNRENI